MKSRLCRVLHGGVLHGGSWLNFPRFLRSAIRYRDNADTANSSAGFRLVGVSKDELRCGRRVLRGGSWLNRPRFLRSAFHYWYYADEAYINAGFRLVGVSKDSKHTSTHCFEEGEDLIMGKMKEKLLSNSEREESIQADLVKALLKVIVLLERELKRKDAEIAVLKGSLADE